MKKTVYTIILLICSLYLFSQNEPLVKKLPVKVTMTKFYINKDTDERNEETKEEYKLEYNDANQLINSVFDYNSYGKKTISANYQYNNKGNLLKEKYTREYGEIWYTTFKYEKYKGLNFAVVRTSYDNNKSIGNEETYPLDLVTGLFIGDKSLGEDNYHEYDYDEDNNLIRCFYNASTMAYRKTEILEYDTIYSPYICINKLPVWYSSSLLLPAIMTTGKHTPVGYTETIEHRYEDEKDTTSKKTYTIIADEDNYPIKIVENRDPDLSDKYLFLREYTFTYRTINDK